MLCSTVRFTPLLTYHGDTFQMAVRAGLRVEMESQSTR